MKVASKTWMSEIIHIINYPTTEWIGVNKTRLVIIVRKKKQLLLCYQPASLTNQIQNIQM